MGGSCSQISPCPATMGPHPWGVQGIWRKNLSLLEKVGHGDILKETAARVLQGGGAISQGSRVLNKAASRYVAAPRSRTQQFMDNHPAGSQAVPVQSGVILQAIKTSSQAHEDRPLHQHMTHPLDASRGCIVFSFLN